MKRIWSVVNTALCVTGAFGAYRSMEPTRLRHSNPDAILCAILVLTLPLFSLGTVYYSIRSRRDPIIPRSYVLRRPSWDRNPLNWRDDPLESLFFSTLVAVAMAAGAAVRWPEIGSVGFWLVGTYLSIATGLAIGQLLSYLLFADLLSNWKTRYLPYYVSEFGAPVVGVTW